MKSLLRFNLNTLQLSTVILCAISYVVFGYLLEREDFSLLLLSFSLLFIGFIILNKALSFKQLTYLCFGYRALFLLAIPNLSQDFYRFIWDGRLILENINPYLYTPNKLVANGNLAINDINVLFEGMGELSAQHYSNYPPLNQLCFIIANLFPGNSILSAVIGLRLLIILADFGILFYGSRLLKYFNLNPKLIFWYLLNPFVIIELTGNLHFEGVMLFFFTAGMYYLTKQKWLIAAIYIGCSISTKLIPLIFLPLFYLWFKNRYPSYKAYFMLFIFYLIVLTSFTSSFLPFISQELITNYSKTIGLWFGKFEFNASLYYIFREIGFLFRGYNEIAIIGKITPIINIVIILFLTFKRNNNNIKTILSSCAIILSSYFFTATTVHPWYISSLLLLSVFSGYIFPLVWSFTIFLSYYTYSTINFIENPLLLLLQYIPVYFLFIWEVILNKKLSDLYSYLKFQT